MHQPRKFRLTVSVILCFLLQAQGADKYTDENRPYEFGFKIDGQQHRHESKDKDGIIMGEFGFITADDVYHVTVYATDKEGRFKILSMKNIHLKSSPAASPGSPTSSRQGHSLALPPAQPASVQAVSQPEKPFKSLEPPGKSCSSCSLPTTTTQAPPLAYNQANGEGNYNSPGQFGAPGISPQNQQAFVPSSAGQSNKVQGGISGSSFLQGGQPDYSQQSQPGYNQPTQPGYNQQSQPGYNQQTQPGYNQQSQPGYNQQNQPGYNQQNPAISQNNPEQIPGTPESIATFPQQPGTLTQNSPSAPSYDQGSNAPNSPNNYAQPEFASRFGQGPGGAGASQAYPGEQNAVTGGGNSPYASSGSQGPTGSAGPGVSQGGLSGSNVPSPGRSSYPQEGAGDRSPKQYNGPEPQFNSNVGPNALQGPGSTLNGQPGSAKPTLVSAQMQIVDKNTDIHSLHPGEKEGLPPGLTKDDMTQLLYTFNYTVGFHGHFEEGYTNGVKKGYYYVTGRNGVRTRIDYVADDSGFHPKVSQDVLDLLSDDVPKPETEKDAKFGLKGYEFKWLYYPVDSKRR